MSRELDSRLSRYLPSDAGIVRHEVSSLLALGAEYAETREQRVLRNQALRGRLLAASDLAVVLATSQIKGLVERELLERLRRRSNVPLGPLFEYINDGIAKMGRRNSEYYRVLGLVSGHVARYSPSAPQAEIVDVMRRFIGSSLERETDLLAETLSWRNDIHAIPGLVIEGMKDGIGKNQTSLHIYSACVQAEQIRDARPRF